MATCTHQIYWPCKHYQYEKCDHRCVCFWLLSTAPFDDMNLKSLELIARRLINYQRIDIFMSDLIHATKKLLNIIPCSCPNQATYIDSFILKENVVTYTKTNLFNTYLAVHEMMVAQSFILIQINQHLNHNYLCDLSKFWILTLEIICFGKRLRINISDSSRLKFQKSLNSYCSFPHILFLWAFIN